MKVNKKIRFVFFDHGGTLAYLNKDTPQIVQEILTESGYKLSLKQITDADKKAEAYWQERYQKLPRGLRFNDYIISDSYKELLSHLDVKHGLGELASKIASEWHDRAGITLYPDTIPCLEELKQLGLQMGVITQTLWTEEEFRRLHLKREGIEDYFDLVLTTESIGIDKPDTRLYLKAAYLAGRSPQEILHVGDSYELDVKGARSANMRAILIVRNERPTSHDCEAICSLHQLPQLILADST